MSDRITPDRSSLARWLPLAVLLAGAAIGAFALRDQLSFEALAANRDRLLAFRDAHYLAAALLFMGAYVLIVAFSLPGAAVASLTGGFLFGVFPGAMFNVIAATTGAAAVFTAVKLGFGDRLAARIDAAEGRVRRLREALRDNETSVLLLMRLVPAVPFFVANLLPALVGVRFGRFVVTTFFGIMPGAVIYTWVGAGLGEVFSRGGTPDPGILFEPRFLLPLLALAGLVALPVLFRALARKEP
jgi:uncharacterized membrane protein YdjX (TVP38/TMEM64 family)